MNRIEEIASTAMVIVSYSRMVKGQVERTWDPKLYDRVFAELIIEECTKVLKQHGSYFSGDNKPYDYAASLIDGCV